MGNATIVEVMPEEEIKEQKESSPDRFRRLRNLPWRKIGLGFLLVLATAVAFGIGYFTVFLWERYSTSGSSESVSTENWEVYKSEVYGLGLRYPADWEAEEIKSSLVIFRPEVGEGEDTPREYISLIVASNTKRGKTLCENDQTKCSFYANEIFGERISTPESEVIFFAHGDNDFTLTLFKYGGADFTSIFEQIGESARFVNASKENTDGDAQNN